ncbi:MAG: hypothetical protein APR55_07575 [Methanolinea sp. SDB]|nr:MAG: hypothetical protein APR55_07575 [Methanolinea sp. SDB]
MIGIDNYLGGYLDRRMKYMIEEWSLGTYRDLGDLEVRLKDLEEEIQELDKFEMEADAKLTDLEKRIERIREVKR